MAVLSSGSRTSTGKIDRGFTLIELLVVVAIIALLIAILLPSLAKAKFRAKITSCASNLKMMAIGTATYASEWGDSIPPPFRHPGDGSTSGQANKQDTEYQPRMGWFLRNNNTGAGTPLAIFGPALMFAPKTGGPTTRPEVLASNLSGTGQISNFKVYYCPAQTSSTFSLPPITDFTTNWLNTLEAAQGGNALMGYMYAVHAVRTTFPRAPSGNTTTWKYPYSKLGRIPKNFQILQDIVNDLNSIPHARGKTSVWNVAFSDGHVNETTSAFTYNQLAPPTNLNVAGTATTVTVTGSAFDPNPAAPGIFYQITTDLVKNSGN